MHNSAKKLLDKGGRFIGWDNPERLDEVVIPWQQKLLAGAIKTRILPRILKDYYYRKDILPIEQHGLTVVGQGYTAIAARDEKIGEIFKFHYTMPGYTENELSRTIEELQRKQEICLTHLGNIAVSQEYEIDTSPYDQSEPIIVARQPFVLAERSIDLQKTIDRDVALIPDIKEFAVGNMNMIEEHRAVADVLGRGNLVVNNEGRLKLIDPIPLFDEEIPSSTYPINESHLQKVISLVAEKD